jgi:excinuclease UvrABC nuclease subunit
MKAYRQGELLFVPQEIKDMEGLKKALEEGKKTTVVAEGEATGHRHEIAEPATATLIDIENAHVWIDNESPRFNNFQKVLHTEAGTTIKHPDHKDLHLPGGTYYIRAQREYDEAEVHRVMD